MRRVIGRPAGYAAALAALWMVLAWLNEGTTYHLAPLLVAIVVPIGVAMEPRRRPADLIPAAAIGAAIAGATTAILVAVDRLAGPSLLPFGGAVTEALLFAIGGAVVGLAMAGLAGGRR